MTSYVKPSRLHVRFWLLLSYLVLAAVSAHAADVPIPRPANGAVSNPNYLEYKKTGNTYTWNPVGTTTPPGSGSISFPGTSTVSDVTPKMTTTGDLPYQHKGGVGAKVTISTGIDKVRVAAAAAAATASAAAMQVKPGNPYVQVGALACMVFCVPVADALIQWGIDQFIDNGDGTFSVEVPDTSGIIVSDGREYLGSAWYPSAVVACNSLIPGMKAQYGNNIVFVRYTHYDNNGTCLFNTYYNNGGLNKNPSLIIYHRRSSCPSGHPIANGVCDGSAATVKKPLDDVFMENIVNKPWGPDAALVASVVIASVGYQSGEGVFTDGTSTTITGPDLVPIGTTTTSSPVNVLPGTTTPAPPGHTGPTDSGIQTTTSTTTATNTFKPGTSGTGGSGSSGSGSGPSMTTGQKTETKTSITNNITNNTSTSVTTNIETKDDAPKEEEKDFCEKNPDSLACAEADTPDGEIPETQIELSYEYESLFGNGSCPTVDAVPFFGQNVQVVDMPKICQQTTDYIQPFVLVSAALIAMAIFAGGVRS